MNIFVPEGRWEVAMADVEAPAMSELSFAPVEIAEAEESPAVEAEQPEVDSEPAAMPEAEAEGPYAGISPVVWILMAAAFVVFLWLFILKRRERQA